jgi:hypothetical protein
MIYRTVPVSTEFDLNAVCGGDGVLFVQSGIGSAGRNEILRTDSDAMRAVLNEMTLSRHAQPTESTLATVLSRLDLFPFCRRLLRFFSLWASRSPSTLMVQPP